jgi:hypothetical protein
VRRFNSIKLFIIRVSYIYQPSYTSTTSKVEKEANPLANSRITEAEDNYVAKRGQPQIIWIR